MNESSLTSIFIIINIKFFCVCFVLLHLEFMWQEIQHYRPELKGKTWRINTNNPATNNNTTASASNNNNNHSTNAAANPSSTTAS
jgi:hypothetical protein